MELTSRQIEETHFTTALRGYDRREVDSFIASCATHTSELEQRTKIAEVQAASSEQELASLRAQIDVLVTEATEARRKIIDEAKLEAETIARQTSAAGGSPDLTEAASKAAAIINEAEVAAQLKLDNVGEIERIAEEKAARILRSAEETAAMTQAEADRVLDKARLDSNSMREETKALRASMDAELAEIRRLLDAARSSDEDTADPVSDPDSELVIDLRQGATDRTDRHAAG